MVRLASPLARAADEGGFLTIQYVAAIGFSLVLFTMLANVVVVQYGRGVVRAALHDGVRAGAALTASDAGVRCGQVADEALGDLLGGSMGDGVAVTCAASPTEVVATADVRFAGWLPGVPDFVTSERAVAVRERLP